ncbi:DUF3618 domain-containing protein [Planomonospora parontospora]|uniref:DUF3618 domain-containing protein n=1 Tax=Planomonospora parontospora TaxID=58119 RepID=UPI001942DC58|nr:DUF3618 domain-containing protein [Planomonospora parontospora]GGL13180.1 hypothetical protein GCM10014719_13890 [Planomonospora parontospora subsp. antibiotica]GII13949.1 hypothetical protein Ppa05_06750 [Planomonospora parontospora subsp. antibiotica]
MSETDPGRGRDVAPAGATGSRRQEIGTPVPPDERGSLNIPPNEPGQRGATGLRGEGAPTDDLGLPPWESDGTPDLVRRDRGSARGPETPEEAVRREIEETRRELGDSVEALMHKTDVKGRVQEKAAHMGDDLKRMGAATAGTATGMLDRVKGAAPEVLDKARQATPAEVRHAAEKVSTEAGRRPFATLAVVGAVALAVVRVMRRRRSGRSGKVELVRVPRLGRGTRVDTVRVPWFRRGATVRTARVPWLSKGSRSAAARLPWSGKDSATTAGRLPWSGKRR